jgi:uncharacterized protein
MTRQHIPRVVIDTNLVLSALVFSHGRLAPLRLAWQSGQCEPLVCKATVAELIRVLAYPKFKLTTEEQQELLADYLPYCSTVTLPAKLPRVPDYRDPHDLPFLYLATVGKADALLSGDQDLLTLKARFACPIMTAESWLSELA